MKQKRIIVFDGPRGVGKDTIMQEIFLRAPDKYKKIVTNSTREPRPEEINGVHYNFIDKETFLEKVKKGDIFEYTEFGGTYRGMSKSIIDSIINKGLIAVVNTDIIGVRALKAAYPGQVISLFVTADKNMIKQRLEQCDSKDINERLENFESRHKYMNESDYIIENNGTREDAVNKVFKIIGDSAE